MPHRPARRTTVLSAAVLTAGTLVAGTVATPARAAGSFTLVTEPADSYGSVYALINGAASTIDMTMYELVDTTAEDDLAAAASRGVKVRVILDQNLEKSNNTAAYNYLSSHGVSVVWANTSYAATHQKTVTVDKATSAILTGNLTSRYYSSTRDFLVEDTDAADVAAIEKVFAADFAGSSVTPGSGDDLVWSPTTASNKLTGLIGSATRTLDVENEEMSSSTIVNALVSAAQRGVAVHITMTSDGSYDSEFDKLVSAGAVVHTYTESASLYIHAKAIVADAATSAHDAYQGSINFSSNSLGKNRELGLITTDAGVDSGLEKTLTGDFNGGTNYTG